MREGTPHIICSVSENLTHETNGIRGAKAKNELYMLGAKSAFKCESDMCKKLLQIPLPIKLKVPSIPEEFSFSQEIVSKNDHKALFSRVILLLIIFA